MQIILDYLNNPENKLYVIVLFVTLVLLILLSGLTVYAYKRKKHAAKITPFIPDKAMPEDIVEVLDDMYAEATDDSAVEFEKNDALDDKTLNKLENIDIPDATDRAADIAPNGIVVLENDGPDDEINEITVNVRILQEHGAHWG